MPHAQLHSCKSKSNSQAKSPYVGEDEEDEDDDEGRGRARKEEEEEEEAERKRRKRRRESTSLECKRCEENGILGGDGQVALEHGLTGREEHLRHAMPTQYAAAWRARMAPDDK